MGKAMKVEKHIVWLFALSILIPLTAFVAIGIQTRAQLMEVAQRDTQAVLDVMQEHMRKTFETQELALDGIEDYIRGMSDADIAAPATSARLASVSDRLEQTVSIWISDAAGDVLAGSLPWRPGLNVAQMDYFLAQMEKPDRYFIGQPFIGRTTQRASFAMSRPRPSENGVFNGTIHVAINPEYFERNFQRIEQRAHGAAALFRTDGTMLARYPVPRTLGKLGPESPVMRAIAAEPQAGLLQGRSTIDGTSRIYAYQRLEPFGVYVGYGVDLPGRIREWLWFMLTSGLVAASASLLLCLATWRVMRSANARVLTLMALRNETERRLFAENELEKARSSETLGRMARGVAHDINNLLTVVIGNVELLSEVATTPPLSTAAQRALEAATSGGKLASGLLAYARTQVLQLRTFDPTAHLLGISNLLSGIAGPRHHLVFDVAQDLPACRADLSQLDACLCNLVANARDALPDGGKIQITAREAILEPEDLNGNASAKPGRFVAIAMADQGHGMEPDVAARAFDPFFTTKPEGLGSGLGLSQVIGLMHQFNGHVTIETAPGKGTTVTLYLPICDDASPSDATLTAAPAIPQPAPPKAAQEPTPSKLQEGPEEVQKAAKPEQSGEAASAAQPKQARILVVDDQPEILSLTQQILGGRGHDVVLASGGSEALAMLEKDCGFDLLLSDVVMPRDLDGITLLRRVKTEYPEIRIALMSGYVPSAEDLGDLDVLVLPKPFKSKALAAFVQEGLAAPG